jgi:hypothetical protein
MLENFLIFLAGGVVVLIALVLWVLTDWYTNK